MGVYAIIALYLSLGFVIASMLTIFTTRYGKMDSITFSCMVILWPLALGIFIGWILGQALAEYINFLEEKFSSNKRSSKDD